MNLINTGDRSFYDAELETVKYTKKVFEYDYEMPSITATCVVICAGHIAVITRRDEPFKGCLALPGGFMNMDEVNLATCIREVKEEIGLEIEGYPIKLVCVNDAINRDPRGRIVDFSYSVIVPMRALSKFKAGDDAADAEWLSIEAFENTSTRPKFAFDHEQVIVKAIEQRRNKIK